MAKIRVNGVKFKKDEVEYDTEDGYVVKLSEIEKATGLSTHLLQFESGRGYNMIATVMSVCGDSAYFKMSKYSIGSFCHNNQNTQLHVFTDVLGDVWSDIDFGGGKMPMLYNFGFCIRKMKAEGDNRIQRIIDKIKDATIDNNGVMHTHSYVALLPLLAEWFVDSEYLMKIDVDSYFIGDVISSMKEWNLNAYDLRLVKRSRGDIMKLYGGAPGVGMTLWKRGGSFVPRYVEEFDGNEQNTILSIAGYKGGLYDYKSSGLFTNESYHICYPFFQHEKLGKEFTKEIAESLAPCYLHIRGPNQIDKLKKLEGWFGQLQTT